MIFPKILVIEDNPISQRLIRMTLATEGYTVVEASDAETALARAKAGPPDLVLMDLGLPDMDGLDLLKRLRELPGLGSVPILAVSGYVAKLEQARRGGAGFADILTKPVEPDMVLRAVEAHLPPLDTASLPGRARRVVVADDDPVQLRLLAKRLEHLGFLITPVEDGVKALQEIRRSAPDAVVADVLMPQPDGFRLCLLIRQDPTLSRLPVVLATSSFVDSEDQRLSESVGANALVLRTPGFEAVVEALLAALREEAPPCATRVGDLLEQEYSQRIVHRLERRASLNVELSRRCSLQAAELAVLTGISESLTKQIAPDLSLVLEQCLDAGGVSAGALFEIKEGGLARRAAVGLSEARIKSLGAWLDVRLEETFQHDGPTTITRDMPCADEARGVLMELDVASLVLLPLSSQGERVGLLILVSQSETLGNQDWLTFVRNVAAQLGQALALARSFMAVADSEGRFRQLAENIDEVFWLTDPTMSKMFYLSPAYERLWGRSCASAYERPLSFIEAIHEEDRPRVAEAIQRDFPRGRFDSTYRVVGLDGSQRWVHARGFGVRSASGELVRIAGIAADVTGLRTAADLACFTAEVGVAVTVTEDARGALGRCTDAAVARLGVAFARIWEFNENENLLQLKASSGLYTHLDGPHARVPLGELKIGRIAATREPHLTNDLLNDPVVDHEWARREGLVAFAGYPLQFHGKLVGVFAVFSKKPLDERALGAMRTAADVIAVALRRKEEEREKEAVAAQFRQAQKMEAVGRLAGGVAHDFNNLLTAIMGYSELMLTRLRHDDPLRHDVEEIRKAGNRATALTRQLLVFSRHQVLEFKVLDPNAIVKDIERMLGRLIGEDIELRVLPGRGLGRVKADAGQIEQVILNLCVNARDAMPRGGRITIETANVDLDEHPNGARNPVRPGRYVMLAVSDSGAGMTQEVLSHLFEPFFTTKEPGKGTGLGLSTVYGIVQGGCGNISVKTELGKGSTFKVYLPRVEEELTEELTPSEEIPLRRGSETILLVEDDDLVRELAHTILLLNGYQVIVAPNGGAALLACEKHQGSIDMMLTDVVMPEMSGKELADRLAHVRPGLKILYFSGYTSGVVLHDDVVGSGSAFIQKPFTPKELARKVRQTLDATPQHV